MIFADKLIRLRKKAGWSQEELAEQLDVSRQSVSKWEGAQSIPELEKIIRISKLFGVSTDYLLKDEFEDTEEINISDEPAIRRVTIEEANAFLKLKETAAKWIAYATFLCIISPICLLILGAISEAPGAALSETLAGALGVIALLLIVGAAVAIFVAADHKLMDFKFLEKSPFETEYGVAGIVKERRLAYKSIYARNNIIGVFLCIIAVSALFVGIIIDESNDVLIVSMLCLMLAIIGVGVILFIRAGVIWGSYEALLNERKEEREESLLESAVSTIYWLVITAVYLGLSFTTGRWGITWVIWIIAAVLDPAVSAIVRAIEGKKS